MLISSCHLPSFPIIKYNHLPKPPSPLRDILYENFTKKGGQNKLEINFKECTMRGNSEACSMRFYFIFASLQGLNSEKSSLKGYSEVFLMTKITWGSHKVLRSCWGQFLEFNSAHPTHIKKSIVYSQGLRIKRLCSSSLAFEKHLESIRSWFGKRGYPKKLVDNQLRRVVENRPEQLPEHQKKTRNRCATCGYIPSLVSWFR